MLSRQGAQALPQVAELRAHMPWGMAETDKQTCIFIQNSSPALKILRAYPSLPPSFFLEPWRPGLFLLSPGFAFPQNVAELDSHNM